MTKRNFIEKISVDMRKFISEKDCAILEQVLQNNLQNIRLEVIQSSDFLPADYTSTNEYFYSMYIARKRHNMSAISITHYMETLDKFFESLHKSILEVTPDDIDDFLTLMSKNNNPVSLNNKLAIINAFLNWMRKNRYIKYNPGQNVERYKEPCKTIEYLQSCEYEKLKNGCKNQRQLALLEVLRCTAGRVSEIVNIKLSEICFETGEVLLYSAKTNTYRVVFLDSIAIMRIEEYLLTRGINRYNKKDEWLFVNLYNTNQMSIRSVQMTIKAIKENAGIEKRVYPHLFRKTTATQIIRKGGTISDAGKYLGHKDNTVTGQYYANIDSTYIKNIFTKFVAQ